MKNKKLFITLIITVISNAVFAQAFKFGTITADMGVGGGLCLSKAKLPHEIRPTRRLNFGGAIPTIDAEFGLLQFLGVGIHYSMEYYNRFAYAYTATGNNFGIMLNFHVANMDEKFDMPIGFTYGITSLRSGESVKYTDGRQHIYASGTFLNIHILPHFYFGKYLGMFIGLEYSNQFFDKTEWLNTDGDVFHHSDGFYMKMDNLQFRMGIAARFHTTKSDE